MEMNFDEGISDEVLKGSFLALKQLQTKGKKVAKLKKSPSTVQKEAGPRSPLYEKFKELHGFGKITPEPLDTREPKSLLMYRTYKEIFAEKNRKIRYTEDTKPEHPFFGKNAVLSEEFTLLETEGSSSIYQEIMEEMEIEGLIKKYNYDMYPHFDGPPKKLPTPVIRPLKKRTPLQKSEDSCLSPEFIEDLQRILVESDDENSSKAAGQ